MIEYEKSLKEESRKLRVSKSNLKKNIERLQNEQVEVLASYKERVKELEAQVDGLNLAAKQANIVRSAQEMEKYEIGYNEGIMDFMKSTWEKFPDLDWSLLGDDAKVIIDEIKGQVVAAAKVQTPAAVEVGSLEIPVVHEGSSPADGAQVPAVEVQHATPLQSIPAVADFVPSLNP